MFEECSGSISDFSTNSITGPDSYNQFISVPGRKIPKIPLQGNSSAGQVTTKMQIQILAIENVFKVYCSSWSSE